MNKVWFFGWQEVKIDKHREGLLSIHALNLEIFDKSIIFCKFGMKKHTLHGFISCLVAFQDM